MPSPSPASARSAAATFAGVPLWLAYSLLTIVSWGAWGALSKVVSDGVDANTNQVFFTFGLLPIVACVALSSKLRGGTDRRAGIGWAFLTGILGGTGNIAFFQALGVGGQASIVVPATALFPLVTVMLALTFLRERLGRAQVAGLVLAMVAIYLLSM